MEIKMHNINADNVTNFDHSHSAIIELQFDNPDPEVSRILWKIMSPAQRFIIFSLASSSERARVFFNAVPACECTWDNIPPSLRDSIAVLSYQLAIVRSKY